MTNDLRILKKELKSFAKRVKDFKYTDSALITFLLTGLIMLSGISLNLYSDEIKTQQEAINTSIFQLQKDFKRARQENNKLLRNTNLELIQLMEQGDHVVKSPWGSFQFGSNYVYNDWKGTYKGRGDKKEAVKYARENDKFGTYAGAKQGTTELKRVIEPISAVPVDAAVRPKDIRKTALNINLPNIGAPQKPNLNIRVGDPLRIEEMSVRTPTITVPSINPNAEPFLDFSFTNQLTAGYYSGTVISDASGATKNNRSTVWNGADQNGNPVTSFGATNTKLGNITKAGSRTDHTVYVNKANESPDTLSQKADAFVVENMNLYLAGNLSSNPVVDSSSHNHDGVIGIHTVRNGTIRNVTGNLYGQADFISIETWHSGKLKLDNVDVNITGDDNTIFYIYPASYEASNGYKTYLHAYHQRGGFTGSIDADIKSNKNIIYNTLGASGSFGIKSEGTYKLEGSNNIVYSSTGYSPDFEKISGSGAITHIAGYSDNLTPFVNLFKPVESYGDGNILMFFANQTNKKSNVTGGNINVWVQASGDNRSLWDKSTIGIYQGEVGVNGIIGEKLNISGFLPTQTADGKKTGLYSDYVEGNIGILGWSGQRVNIKPDDDLGAEKSVTNNADYKIKDPIHSLWVNNADISFGKHALSGIMFASQNGTVMDVARSANKNNAGADGVAIRNKAITDYGHLTLATSGKVVASESGTNEAATGTIIAYSQGVFGDKMNRMSSSTNGNLRGMSSEINIGPDVEMSGRYHKIGTTEYYPIAYLAKDGGKITAEKSTKAYGYGSLVAYAENLGNVTTTGDVTAVDAWADKTDTDTKKLLYTNIGAYAKKGAGQYQTQDTTSLGGSTKVDAKDSSGTTLTTTEITMNGNLTINGLGALADGNNAVVNLKGSGNVINTGTSGALIAQNGGTVNFYGGTITNQDNSAARGLSDNDHKNVTPFYAKAPALGTDGTIIFHNPASATTLNKSATTIKMFDGVVIADDPSTYQKNIGTGKYQGLGNVTVEINNNDVIIGVYDDNGKAARTWYNSTDTGTPTFTSGLDGVNQFGDITYNNGATFYTVVLKNGKLDVQAPTVSLDNIGDKYNGIKMANELVTISNGTTVSGNIAGTNLKGQGLSMGNISKATQVAAGITPTNTTSGFINKGTVNVTGGTTAAGIAGINVSYGTINNDKAGKVTVDNGAGLYATNGSKIVNDGTVTVSGKGVGIAGLGTGQTKQDYGTDVANGTTVEIVNNGTLNVSGDEAIGIYAENNTGTARANVKIDNTSPITVGTKGVGIALVSTAPTTVSHGAEQGGTITLTPAGATDITTGVQGTGIYAEDSDINLGSGDYVVETKEKGVGIFASGNTKVNGTLEYKYNGSATGTGMGIVYDQDKASNLTNYANVKLTNSTNTTGGMVGLYTTAAAGNKFINNGNVEGKSTALEFGIVTNGADVENAGKITLGDATKQAEANVGIYAKAKNKISNSGTITVGNNAIGIYGYNVDNNGTIKAGDNGAAIYTQDDGTVNLNGGSTVKVSGSQAVGVYAVGTNQNLNANAGSTLSIGDDSFGFVDAGKGNTITSYANPVTLGSDAIYAYQNDNTGKIVNYTPLASSGDRNYGLYGNGTTENYGTIDFSNGNGNVGIYSTNGGVATNFGTIKVGPSNTSAKEYGVGMATGYYDEATNKTSNEGTIINRGTIEVSKANTMGMYAVGPGSKAINYGTINLSGRDTIGMYLDRGAHGENWGTIQTTVSGLRGVKGIYLSNGSYIKNYGTINIAASDIKSAGIWADTQSFPNAEENSSGRNPITGASQTGTSTPLIKVVTADDMKEMGGVTIKVPPRMTPVTVTDAQGNVIPIVKVDTDTPAPNPVSVTVTSPSGITTLNLAVNNMQNFPSASEATSIGMYVDTSGVNYTNPIQGLNNLVGLEDISLYFGPEASRYTTSKAIEIGDNILKPYNDALRGLVTAGTTLYVTSPSLTWMAQPTKDPSTGLLDKVYLVKVPYTAFAKDGDDQTYNFLAGLEKRYGVEGLGTQEKLIFDKISSLTGGEGHILAQAIDEMKGHQYSNIQQRTKETGDILNNEFSYLQNEWENPTKDSSKIKAFGQRGEYKTDTAGVVDYASNAYGVAYVHEKEGVTLGNKTGWYAGAVTNHFKFKDLGRSREDQTMMKAGIFKTVSPAKDHNGSLQWTISGEAFAGANHMKRRYWVVDDTFEAKSDYATYGVALRNELGKDIRTSERTSIRPYGALNLEYGRYTGIKEDGPMALEVRGNDYISVQPEAGVSFNYRQPVGLKSSLKASLAAAYTNELGEVNDVKNKAKLRGADAPHYELRGDKENRKGSGKFDLNLGFENTRFGVTVNAGYDTKGENVRGGIGFRAIY